MTYFDPLRDPIKQAEAKLKEQALRLEQMRRLLDEQAQVIATNTRRLSEQQAIIDQLCDPAYEIQKQVRGEWEWVRVPQEVLVAGVTRLICRNGIELERYIESLYADWESQQEREAQIAAKEY